MRNFSQASRRSSLFLALALGACGQFDFQKNKNENAGAAGVGGAGSGGLGGASAGVAGSAAQAGGGAGMGGTHDSAGATATAGAAEAGAGGSAGEAAGGATSASGGTSAAGASSGGVHATGGTSAGMTSGGALNCPLPGEAAGAAGAGEAGAGGASSVDPSAVALTPPMGWNSWNRFQGGVSESLVRQTADAMVSSGMAALGYQYVVIDDTWQASRDACGNIQPDPVRFAGGIKALAAYVHSKGLKIGLYSDRGTATCAGRPGSLGYETRDAATYAAWGIDYLKYDNCNVPDDHNLDNGQADYTKMRDALRATGRPIVYSISAWWFYSWMPSVGNLWRTTTDIADNFATDYHSAISLITKNGEDTSRFPSFSDQIPDSAAYGAPGLAQYAGPGHWNDPDMLEIGNGGMSDTEYRSHFSMWAMMAAPLIAGNDVVNMTQATKDILLNSDVIAVDQDPLGKQGRPLSGTSTTLEVWSKPLSGTNTFAVALLNRTTTAANITVNWSDLELGLSNASVRDLWAHTDLGSIATSYTANVPGHGVVLLRVVGE